MVYIGSRYSSEVIIGVFMVLIRLRILGLVYVIIQVEFMMNIMFRVLSLLLEIWVLFFL